MRAKSAVKIKNKQKVKAKIQTRSEKKKSFAQLREKMMSNWGTK